MCRPRCVSPLCAVSTLVDMDPFWEHMVPFTTYCLNIGTYCLVSLFGGVYNIMHYTFTVTMAATLTSVELLMKWLRRNKNTDSASVGVKSNSRRTSRNSDERDSNTGTAKSILKKQSKYDDVSGPQDQAFLLQSNRTHSPQVEHFVEPPPGFEPIGKPRAQSRAHTGKLGSGAASATHSVTVTKGFVLGVWLSPIMALLFLRTVTRNEDWKNEAVLFRRVTLAHRRVPAYTRLTAHINVVITCVLQERTRRLSH